MSGGHKDAPCRSGGPSEISIKTLAEFAPDTARAVAAAAPGCAALLHRQAPFRTIASPKQDLQPDQYQGLAVLGFPALVFGRSLPRA